MSPPPASDPVSLVVRRRVRPGHDAAYEGLLSELTALLARAPGHRGTGILRPAQGERDYTVIARFDDLSAASAWEAAPERAAWLARIAPHIDEHLSFERQPGLDYWFTPPGSPVLRQPPRWKMALLTLLALYPVSLGVTLLLAPHLGGWPLWARALIQMTLVVPLMTYLVMPAATRAAGRWLEP